VQNFGIKGEHGGVQDEGVRVPNAVRSTGCAAESFSHISHLDAWWAKLGSRLRDVPGHEFPRLPERVSQALQHLWNEALDGAREALQQTLLQREQTIAEREQGLDERTRQLAERELATTARTGALEESLALAREQLAAANQRAQALEGSVQERDAEGTRLRSRIERLEAECVNWRAKLDAANAAHHGERVQLQGRYAAAESHWMLEVDRARQHAKEATKEHENQTKELRRRVEALMSKRDELRQDLLGAQAELKTAAAVRDQLLERLREAAVLPTPRPKRSGQRQRSTRSRGTARSTTNRPSDA
jgi:chromosome segregation ATPase